MNAATIAASVLAANGLTIWIAVMFRRIQRDEKDLSAILQIIVLLMVVAVLGVSALQTIPE